MSKTQQVKAIAAQRSKAISAQIQELRQLQSQSVESLARQIEPLAQSLATLSDEARESIIKIVQTAAHHQQQTADRVSSAAEKWGMAAKSVSKERQALQSATKQITASTDQAARQLRGVTWKIWIAAISSSTLIALALVSAYAIWQPPLSSNEKAAVRYFNAIAPDHQRQIIETVKRNNL